MGNLDKQEPVKIALSPDYHKFLQGLCPKCKDAVLWRNYQTKGDKLCRADRNQKKERKEAVNDEYVKKPIG
jgi:uncharacterized protein (DUF983 family)